MKKSLSMFLLFALVATGVWAQVDGTFDCVVNETYTVAPSGTLPYGEVGVPYVDARVFFQGGENTAPTGGYKHVTYRFPVAGDVPPGVSAHVNLGGPTTPTTWNLEGSPTTAGTYTFAVRAVYGLGSNPNAWEGPDQYYTITVQPAGSGVTYPPAPPPGGGGSTSESGGGGDDGGCSALPGAGAALPSTFAGIFAALLWRRRRKK